MLNYLFQYIEDLMKYINSLAILLTLTLYASQSAALERQFNDLNTMAEFALFDSLDVAGTESQMSKRAAVLFYLYLDSDKNFPFAYSISHLTLAIERSATTPRVEKAFKLVFMDSYGESWSRWGNGLKQINQQMVQRLHFGYRLSKLMYQANLQVSDLNENSLSPQARSYYQDIKKLMPLFYEIHSATQSGIELSESTKDRHFQEFVQWEHAYIIQPKIENLFKNLPSAFQYMLRNVPGRIVEFPLNLAFKVRTTLNLQCFNNNTYLKTEDFLDPEVRIAQAEAFYLQMKRINFDPSYSCFNDDYYITQFPFSFLSNPEQFTYMYYDTLSDLRLKSDNERWLHAQYQNIPLEEFAAIPSPNVQVHPQDRAMLSMLTNAVQKNDYINNTYHKIAVELSQCMGVERKVGNWYDFAKWASISGGKVISESKFKELPWFRKLELGIADKMDWTSKDLQVEYFTRANTLIALEMLPLGKTFLEVYCGDKPADSFEAFHSFIPLDGSHSQYIFDAFKNYFNAIHETNYRKKVEFIALASTLQVMGEQLRVDDNLDAVFDIDTRFKLGNYIFRLVSTKNGGLVLGEGEHEKQVPLHKDVSTKDTMIELRIIGNPDYLELHSKYELPQNIWIDTYLKDSGVKDWSRWPNRFKFLIGMFRTNINYPGLLQEPKIKFADLF